MHTAATLGTLASLGSGCRAFVQSDVTRPGVSAPSNVVRSTMEMARSNAASFVVFFRERVASLAVRASAPTASTPERPASNPRSWDSDSTTGNVEPLGNCTPRSSPVTKRSGAILTRLTLAIERQFHLKRSLDVVRQLTGPQALHQCRRSSVLLAGEGPARQRPGNVEHPIEGIDLQLLFRVERRRQEVGKCT